jgi:hypothetical protein
MHVKICVAIHVSIENASEFKMWLRKTFCSRIVGLYCFTTVLGLKTTNICVPFGTDSLADTSAYCYSTENNLFFTLSLIKHKERSTMKFLSPMRTNNQNIERQHDHIYCLYCNFRIIQNYREYRK